ncbi:S-adenosyl-L-methionine-dependent methyltransferase [Wallemia mellicola]|uniref:type I protein arginine methyltransferase n=1 Tax=Wallemia mellicola TaxID=1708541 RepID=A0AB38MS66_9BASI|nr:S-adenosyl-L-methionine-dependent methyltransferase [Wallemia mellicola]
MSSSSESSVEEDYEGWLSDDVESKKTIGLTLNKEFDTPAAALEFDKQNGLDLLELIKKLDLDYYNQIRLINFIRKNGKDAVSSVKPTDEFFKNDEYLIPVIEADPLLFQLDNQDDWSDDEKPVDNTEERITKLQQQLNQSATFINNNLLNDNFVDNEYFESYDYNEIHETMIKDHVRTASYAEWILNNKDLIKDKTIMDVGCGTGILSLLAAKAGAKKVYAIDASNIVDKARENVANNDLSGTIEVIRGKVEEIKLEGVTVDVIISEWMGYFLLFEAMLDSVIVARDSYLKPEGVMAPSHMRIVLGAASTHSWWNERVAFWDNIYGFKMSGMPKTIFRSAQVESFDDDSLISDSVGLLDINTKTQKAKALNFSSPFSLTVKKDETMHGLLGWFDTFFTDSKQQETPKDCNSQDPPSIDAILKDAGENHKDVSFTTGPHGTETHWKQTLFPFQKPLHVKEGDKISGTFTSKKSDRGLEMEVVWKHNDNEEIKSCYKLN